MASIPKKRAGAPRKRAATPPSRPVVPPQLRAAAGQAVRDHVPRSCHGDWQRPHDRRDPIDILAQASKGRIPELAPIRYGRMLKSPFTFLRGSAALMAYDLARTPTMGVAVQACGDCHLLNFGLFATPERNLVFDLNDFDETHPAPWEWDVKRLVASFVVAARDSGLSDAQARDAVSTCVGRYREHMGDCVRMSPLEVWYERLDIQRIIDQAPDAEGRRFREQLAAQARRRIAEHLFPKIATASDGKHRLIDQPPLLYHVPEPDFESRARRALAEYRLSLSDDRRVLLDRYHPVDFALKVVGIGSVGTRCYIGLLMSDREEPLMLQFKEAKRSVLERYTAKCVYDNQGQRVVMGQRLMQSSSDIFLGWVRGKEGNDFYVRQLRDMKMSLSFEGLKARQLVEYARACGFTLARAHAKGGDPAAISGYLGKGDKFDRALVKFAFAYADQTERDHATLAKAVRSGRVEVLSED